MAELTAIGPEPDQWWQNSLLEGEVIRLGRAPRHGWKVPWDIRISREHADLVWQTGRLHVQTLEVAANPIVVQGRKGKRFLLEAGDSFRIGRTEFLLSDAADEAEHGAVAVAVCGRESHDSIQLEADRRLDLVTRLPDVLGAIRSDEELAEQLTILLLDALPSADSAATFRFDCLADVHRGRAPLIRWDARDARGTTFAPSRELIRLAAVRGTGVIDFPDSARHLAPAQPRHPAAWAICAPVISVGPEYWCFYLEGRVEGSADLSMLRADLCFLTLVGQYLGALLQVKLLKDAQAGMSRFFSPAVVESMSGGSREALLTPRACPVSILFCDVRGFSRMSEESAGDLFPFYHRAREALGVMTRGIVRHEGVIADFQGDAALGFWGWPAESPEGALPACRAALSIQRAFARANSAPNHLLVGFRVGIGLAHGQAIAGKIGADEHAKVGVFGPVVNLGARLQGLTHQLQAPILMDEATAVQVRSELQHDMGRCRRLGRFRPCGVSAPVAISELVPPLGEGSRLTGRNIAEFEGAMNALAMGDWSRARALLECLPADDGPSRFYRDFMVRHGDKPPDDWDGVVSLASK